MQQQYTYCTTKASLTCRFGYSFVACKNVPYCISGHVDTGAKVNIAINRKTLARRKVIPLSLLSELVTISNSRGKDLHFINSPKAMFFVFEAAPKGRGEVKTDTECVYITIHIIWFKHKIDVFWKQMPNPFCARHGYKKMWLRQLFSVSLNILEDISSLS